jgi:hypothetical protein
VVARLQADAGVPEEQRISHGAGEMARRVLRLTPPCLFLHKTLKSAGRPKNVASHCVKCFHSRPTA